MVDDDARRRRTRLPGVIDALLFVGDRYEARVTIGSDQRIVLLLSRAREWKEGQPVSLAFPAGRGERVAGVAAPAAARGRRGVSTRPSVACSAVLAVVAFGVVYPMLLVVLQSFQVALPGEPARYGLDGWRAALAEPALRQSLLNTLAVTLVRQLLSLPLAVFIAWLLARTDLPGRPVDRVRLLGRLLPAHADGDAQLDPAARPGVRPGQHHAREAAVRGRRPVQHLLVLGHRLGPRHHRLADREGDPAHARLPQHERVLRGGLARGRAPAPSGPPCASPCPSWPR